MATELKLPQLGENVDSGVLARLLVQVGATVKKDQPVLELETDKATVEVPAFSDGVVKEILVKEGERVKVGQTILTLDAADDNGAAAPTKTESQAEAQAAPPSAEAPQEPQESPAQRAPSSQPAQATAAEPARQSEDETNGAEELEHEQRLRERALAQYAGSFPDGGTGAPTSTPPPPVAPAPLPETKRAPVPASPSVRRLARELGVDIYAVLGTGPSGRISDSDVKTYAKSVISGDPAAASGATATAAMPGLAPLPDFSKWGAVERTPMSGIRRKTAENMRNAWLTVPHVTQHDQADITALDQLRKQFAKQVEAAGGKLTVTAITLKVIAAALKVFPQFNASIDQARDEIVFRKYYHVGVAVDTDRGLLVPVIRDVDKKNIRQLAVEMNQLAEKARNKKLKLEEMQGGSFTITNLGGIGGTSFTPIVNAPEAAILGMSRASFQPVYNGSGFEPRLMLPLSLSYDHRLIDGADAARFLRWVAQALEQPFLLALEG
ncbi:MAG: 2-oxo acid dehydrogenase subunit E2 [Blastocatellia bacterium]